MSIGHFADDDRLGDGADGLEPQHLHLDAGLVRAFRRRSWVGGSLVVTELVNWLGHNPIVQSIAHYASLPLAIILGLDLIHAGAVKCYRSIMGKVYILDMTGRNPPDRRRGQRDPRWPDRPDHRE